jgi:hypothetical protein
MRPCALPPHFPDRHASRHARQSRHRVIASAECDRWLYCYVHDVFFAECQERP